MKITGISTYILRVPLGTQRFYSSQCSFPERNSLLVRIDTDEGISGWGEGGQYGPPEPVAVCIEEVLAPLILGREPLPTRIWEDLYSFSRDFGQKGTYIEAISAIDIALWDILGKMTGQPVHRLLGGAFRDSVGTYATGCYYRGADVLDYRDQLAPLAEEAAGYIDQGFSMLKIKVGLLPVEADLERVAAIRDRIGPGPKLMVDANHAYNVFTAVRLGRAMESYGILWFEEPVVPEDREGYRRVRDSIDIPVAGERRSSRATVSGTFSTAAASISPSRISRYAAVCPSSGTSSPWRPAEASGPSRMSGAPVWHSPPHCRPSPSCRPSRTRRTPSTCRTSRWWSSTETTIPFGTICSPNGSR